MTFTILRPVTVTDAMLVSSNVPETDEAAWNADTTYAVGALVMRKHAVYENSEADNKSKPPEDNPKLWVRVRATNRWRVFDRTNSSRTAKSGTISYVFASGGVAPMVTALDLVNCNHIRVRLIDPVYGTVYDKSIYPGPTPVQPDWWEWFFGDWGGGQTIVIFDDIPSFPNAQLHVDFIGGTDLAVGQLLFGSPRTWGLEQGILQGARVGRQIYSRRQVNDFGDIELVKRPSAKRSSFKVVLRAGEVDALQAFLDEIDAELCLFIGSQRFESTVIFGIFQSADVVLSSYSYSNLDIEVLGAI